MNALHPSTLEHFHILSTERFTVQINKHEISVIPHQQREKKAKDRDALISVSKGKEKKKKEGRKERKREAKDKSLKVRDDILQPKISLVNKQCATK